MKKIGFVDYFLSEWHANNYPEWIRQNVRQKGREEIDVCFAYAALERSPYDNVTTDEWCAKNNVHRVDSIEELCEKSDYIVILSPDNPEYHLEYAEKVFKSGKPVYIDKTFAPDLATAKKIVGLAEKYNAPFYSSSALRFASELDVFRKNDANRNMIAFGPGNVPIYSVHTLEIINTVMKNDAKQVMSVMDGLNRVAIFEYKDGRRAVFTQAEAPTMPFAVAVEEAGKNEFIPIKSDSFAFFIDEMLDFFQKAKLPVRPSETLEVIAMRDALIKAMDTPFQWVKI